MFKIDLMLICTNSGISLIFFIKVRTFYEILFNNSLAGDSAVDYVLLIKYHTKISEIVYSSSSLTGRSFSNTNFKNSDVISSCLTSSVAAIVTPSLPPKVDFLNSSIKRLNMDRFSSLIFFTRSSQLT